MVKEPAMVDRVIVEELLKDNIMEVQTVGMEKGLAEARARERTSHNTSLDHGPCPPVEVANLTPALGIGMVEVVGACWLMEGDPCTATIKAVAMVVVGVDTMAMVDMKVVFRVSYSLRSSRPSKVNSTSFILYIIYLYSAEASAHCSLQNVGMGRM